LSAKKKSITGPTVPAETVMISIIIPAYNVENYLAESVESVLSQDVGHLEIIAINDGSNDSTGKILENYEEKNPRIKIIHQENRGLSAVRNLGLKLAKGKYVYFFDSDDILLPDTLQRVIDRLEATGSDLARFSVGMIDEEGNLRNSKHRNEINGLDFSEPVRGEEFVQYLFQSGKYGAIVQKFVFLRSFLVQNHLQFDEGYIHEDEAFTMESLCLAEKVVSFNDVMLLKRIRAGSIMSTQRDERNVKGWLKASRRLLKFMDKHSFSEETESVIKTKVSQLILISLNNIREINKRTSLNLDLFNYITETDLRKIGFTFNLKVKYNFIYRAYFKTVSIIKKVLKTDNN
jgi:glycosyltransferase involved in cell wall biosynthesis